METSKLIGTGELARRLGLSPRTIARYVAAGLITPDLVTAGGHYRWDEQAVRQQLAELRERPSE